MILGVPVSLSRELSTSLADLAMTSPLVLAAGTSGYVDELADVADLSPAGRVGAIVTKSITRESRDGAATLRIVPQRPAATTPIEIAFAGSK